MKSVYIYLQRGALVKDFVDTISKLEGKFELISDLTVLDAKSILGIYGLDLSAPILLTMENDSRDNIETLRPFFIS